MVDLSLAALKIEDCGDLNSEFSLNLPHNPDEIIRILNDVPVQFVFEIDQDDGDERDANNEEEKANFETDNQLLDKLEAINGIDREEEKKLGIYNQEQRIERLNAYRARRQQRNFGQSKVRYVVRQKASANRVRVHGRFALASETAAAAATPPPAAPAAPPVVVAVATKTNKEDFDWDQPAEKMMRRTVASSSLSWLVQHHRKSSAFNHNANNSRKGTFNSSVGSYGEFLTARGLQAELGMGNLSAYLAINSNDEMALMESHLLMELDNSAKSGKKPAALG